MFVGVGLSAYKHVGVEIEGTRMPGRRRHGDLEHEVLAVLASIRGPAAGWPGSDQ
jgi:hypothetical protein